MQHSNPQPMIEKVRIHNPLTSDYYDVDDSLLISRELRYISELCDSCIPKDEFRKGCRNMFHREGKDYNIQKFGKNLVMMCKVCKRKSLFLLKSRYHI